jgi:3-hydroxyisobutyrate dehydrogenase
MVGAPISGGPRGAELQSLSVIVGASDRAYLKVKDTLSSFARQVTHVGSLGSGHAIKSINNILNVTHLMIASEGIAALTKMG